MKRALEAAAILLVSTIVGCGGGGGGGGGGGATPPPPPAPIMQVLPQSYDFGRVTTGNTPEPLQITIRNVGNAPLSVGPIAFASGSDPEFTFDFATAQPCGSGAFTVAAGGSCTLRVNFDPTANQAYDAIVRVTPTAAAAPAEVAISGTAESVSALTVRINQVDTACPSNAATAYVSVTDQGGFAVTGLGTNQFTLRQGSPLSSNLLLNATPVSAAYKPLAVSAVVDNSGSITGQPVAYAEMKAGFASLFNGLRANDVGELINFGTVFQITVPFPTPSSTANATNKAALVNGLAAPWTGGVGTLLYDTLYRAVDDTALQTGYRRAVIVATDGVDTNEAGTGPASTRTRAEVIANAVNKKVPVYAIGLGGSVDTTALQELASGTGGVFYRAGTSQNLATIYAQLSSLLFEDQYVLTFNQLTPGAGTVSPLRVDVVNSTGLTGNAASSIIACN